MAQRRVGLWLVGAWGGVASTATLGLAALSRRLIDATAIVSANPVFAKLDLDPFDAFVVGGHDIRKSSFSEAIRDLHQRSGVFDERLIEECRPQLETWNANVRPGTVLGAGATIGKLVDLSDVQRVGTPKQAIERIHALRDAGITQIGLLTDFGSLPQAEIMRSPDTSRSTAPPATGMRARWMLPRSSRRK